MYTAPAPSEIRIVLACSRFACTPFLLSEGNFTAKGSGAHKGAHRQKGKRPKNGRLKRPTKTYFQNRQRHGTETVVEILTAMHEPARVKRPIDWTKYYKILQYKKAGVSRYTYRCEKYTQCFRRRYATLYTRVSAPLYYRRNPSVVAAHNLDRFTTASGKRDTGVTKQEAALSHRWDVLKCAIDCTNNNCASMHGFI